MVFDAQSQKSQAKEVWDSMEVNSLLERMRKLLVGSSQQEESLTSIQEFRVIDYNELNYWTLSYWKFSKELEEKMTFAF